MLLLCASGVSRTCGCSASETRQRAVLVCEAIRTCSLLAADAQSLPAAATRRLALALLYSHVKQHSSSFVILLRRIHLVQSMASSCN